MADNMVTGPEARSAWIAIARNNARYDLADFGRQLYWNIRRKPASLGHITAMLARSVYMISHIYFLRFVVIRRPICLIGCIGRLGDIVSAEPVARFARRELPDAAVVWCCKDEYVPIVRHFGAVDRVVQVKCVSEWVLIANFLKLQNKINLEISGNHTCVLCWATLNKNYASNNISLDNYYSQPNLLAAQCLSAGISPLSDSPILDSDQSAVAVVASLTLPADFIVVHCVSSEARRDWPAGRWRELVRDLTEKRGLVVVEVGLKPVASLPDNPRSISLCGRLSVLETAEVIRRARLFIGVDSGPAHIAHAVGTRGVILLGAYRNFKRYTPYSGAYVDGRLAELVRAEGPAATLTVETVVAAVERGLLAAASPAASVRASDNRPADPNDI